MVEIYNGLGESEERGSRREETFKRKLVVLQVRATRIVEGATEIEITIVIRVSRARLSFLLASPRLKGREHCYLLKLVVASVRRRESLVRPMLFLTMLHPLNHW